MNLEIVGRDAERAAVEEFVRSIDAGAAGLAIEGEPGIGKSTLWQEAVAAARAAGRRVLEARPATTEIRLSFSGLVDLLDHDADEVLDRLPEPQRVAIETALYRLPATVAAESPIVGVAVLHALRLLAAERPLVLAIDDVQWLDEPTTSVLGYAVRRIRDERIGVLTARRIGATGSTAAADGGEGVEPGATDELDLVGGMPAGRKRTVRPGPLAVGALHHLVRTRFDVSLPRPTLVRIHEQSRGNPFYALELGRDWAARQATAGTGSGPGGPDAGATHVTIPDTLRELLRRRLDGLPAEARAPLLIAALASQPTVDLVARVLEQAPEGVLATLAPARAAGVLEAGDTGPLRISHPLLAATIAELAGRPERQRIHRRLAALAVDPEERARHLAAADDVPDLATATALAQAAELAAARGATAAAVELLGDAIRRWPDEDPAGRNRAAFSRAERLFLAGDTTLAHRELDALVPDLHGDLLVEASILLATVMAYDSDARIASDLLERLLPTTDNPKLKARVHARLAWIVDFDLPAAAAHARAAVTLLDPAVEPALYSFALLTAAAIELQLGLPPDHAAIERAHLLQEQLRTWDYSSLPANWAKWMDDFDRSRALTEMYIERARDIGDDSSIAHLMTYLAELECWTGRMDRAAALADEAVEAADQAGQPAYLSSSLARRALVRAYRGRLEEARAEAKRARDLGVEINSPVLEALGLAVLAFIDLSAGDLRATAAAADRALALLDGTGMVDHVMFRFHADQIEAHIGLGELDLAERLLERHEERNRIAPRPWLELTGLRARALLAAARGDVGSALDWIDRALEVRERPGMPLETGRTWLVAGQLRRRAGKRKAAAAALEAAESLFLGLGAETWVERARTEIGTLGIARGTDADELTPSELRIATLAASGLTNREVAERLVISPKTVEATLVRAYEKLGIRRRAELGARLGQRPPTDAA